MKILITLMLLSFNLLAGYWETLPKGVRAVGVHYLVTDDISSSYGKNRDINKFYLKQNLNSRSLENLTSSTKTYFNNLKNASLEAFDKFSMGEFEGGATAQIRTWAFGIAYGLTNDITIQASIPFYKAKIDVYLNQTQSSNYQEVKTILDKTQSSSQSQSLINDITSQLPPASTELFQSVIVNYFGYKPIGNWEANDWGDLSLQAWKRWGDKAQTYGHAALVGIDIPTGRKDNPDILQDMAFGEETFVPYIEYGGGKFLAKHNTTLEGWSRLSYFFPTEKKMRIPESSEYPLSKASANFTEKKGIGINLTARIEKKLTDQFSFELSTIYQYLSPTKYESQYPNANTILSNFTKKESLWLKTGIHFSTITLFKSSQFPIPLSAFLTHQTMVGGRNALKYTRTDLEIRMFF